MRNGGSGPPARAASARGLRLLVASALLAALLLPGVPPAAAELEFTFEGGGWGHSVGMSQYGAYGMARAGYTWQEILTHYFSGASPAEADPSLLAEPIWVGLAQEQSRLALEVTATGPAAAAPVSFTNGRSSLTATAGETVTIEALGGGTCRVSGPTASFEGPCSIDAEWDGWEEEPTTAVRLAGCVLPDWNAPGGTVWKPCRYARGTLHIRADNNTSKVNLSLEINIEDYVLGISESPYAWGTTGGQAALEAQAVAARSYALHRVVMRGDPASRPWCWCQLYDTTVDQFYVGWGHGTQPWLDAVAATAGRVMVHPSETLDGTLIPIQTFYSSSTFGWTENSEDGFGSHVPYLRAVDDHWSLLPEVGNPKARWSRTFGAGELASRLPGLASVTDARVTRCSDTGAALEITFSGQGGPRAFTTRDLRSRLGLPSMQIIQVGAPPSGSPACEGFALDPLETGGPVTLDQLTVDDDAVDDSAGDGDGAAECGEGVEVLTILANRGDELRGVNATLSSIDPYVSVRRNTYSAFPDLPAGGSAANLDDWDLAVSDQAPDGHVARLDLRVTTANGGPWDLEVSLPVVCRAPSQGILADPGDVNGDGTPDVAVAYVRAGDAPRLQVRSGTDGTILATHRLGRAGYVPVAAVTVPNFADSPADELAILLTRPNRPARVVVVDGGTGRRLEVFRLGGRSSYLDIEVVPSSGGATGPRLAVLSLRPSGGVRVLLRDAATGTRLGGIGFGRRLAPAALALFPGNGGEALAAVLGNGTNGALKAPVRRVADKTLVTTVLLAPDLVAGQLVVLAPAGAGARLVAVGRAVGARTAGLVSSNPATGEIIASFSLAGLSSTLDLEVLGDPGDGSAAAVAVLGRATGGEVTAMLLDPLTGRALAAPRFTVGCAAVDLGAAATGRSFAALEQTAAGQLLITVFHAPTGAVLASFAVP